MLRIAAMRHRAICRCRSNGGVVTGGSKSTLGRLSFAVWRIEGPDQIGVKISFKDLGVTALS